VKAHTMVKSAMWGLQSDVLKATLATDAVIGAMASVHTPGSGYVLLHHVMGETNGARGIWS
jgi:phytoene dehydrogenase-like protein